jgi:hypothetical protein
MIANPTNTKLHVNNLHAKVDGAKSPNPTVVNVIMQKYNDKMNGIPSSDE